MNTSENGNQRTRCPYFQQEMHACGLHSEGLYLPSRAHVLTYCLTPSYSNCVTFKRYFSSGKPREDESDRTPAGRRRFTRFPGSRRVRIRSCNPLGVVTGELEEKATTVDYSQNGMRIVMDREIPEGSLVLFDFDDDFLIPRLQGVAELRWYRTHPDADRPFEAGLTFRDHFSKAALAVELEQ